MYCLTLASVDLEEITTSEHVINDPATGREAVCIQELTAAAIPLPFQGISSDSSLHSDPSLQDFLELGLFCMSHEMLGHVMDISSDGDNFISLFPFQNKRKEPFFFPVPTKQPLRLGNCGKLTIFFNL